MKKLLPITLAMFVSLTALGQIQIKEINESLEKVNDKLYASKYEVSNKLYITFLNSLEGSENKDLLSIAQIDTSKWIEKSPHNEAYAQYYHTHVAYESYPVVNISYEASLLFCEWLTERYNSDPKRKFNKVVFRLPSEKEWITSAQAGDDSAMYPWQGNDIHHKSGQVMSNFKREEKASLAPDGKQIKNADITAPVKSYWENNFGLYNMSGNVAEMINEKGVVKGGSWKDDQAFLKIDSKHNYDGDSQPNVGFRYFVEIIEK